MTRETVGKISSDLLLQEAPTKDPIELEREMHTDYEKNVWDCVQRCIKEFPHSDFFVIVVTKKERLMQNVIRNYFFGRQSCPTPEYDQTVYRYTAAGDLEFLWVVPSKDTCELMRENALMIAPEEKELLRFVLEFYDGTLLKISKKYNKEAALSNIIEL